MSIKLPENRKKMKLKELYKWYKSGWLKEEDLTEKEIDLLIMYYGL